MYRWLFFFFFGLSNFCHRYSISNCTPKDSWVKIQKQRPTSLRWLTSLRLLLWMHLILVTYIGTSVITCCCFALANGRLALVCTVWNPSRYSLNDGIMTATNKRSPLHSLGGSTHNGIIRKRALRSRPAPDHCVPRTHSSLLPFAPQTTHRKTLLCHISIGILVLCRSLGLYYCTLTFSPAWVFGKYTLNIVFPHIVCIFSPLKYECDLCRHFATAFGRTFRSGLCSSPCQSRQGEER